MGVDELAVVDPELRVRGVDGLRVADASVMPEVTSGNTHAPTVMIGERASDLVVAALGALSRSSGVGLRAVRSGLGPARRHRPSIPNGGMAS